MASAADDGEVETGYIDRLEIENFKSYRGHQKIGPFKKFTAIIGPNGSGKSNLMDAISFVLGVRTAQLRGSLRELLYLNSDGSTSADRPRQGHVALVFIDPDRQELCFSRHITPSAAAAAAAAAGDDEAAAAGTYSSVYRINGRQVSWEQYNKRLESYGILVRARNFLVFQGDIEHVAAMSPRDLTSLFEHVSGSEALRKRYEELEAAKNEAEERQSFVFSKKKSLVVEKRQKKEQKEEAERHIKLQQELDGLRLQSLLFKLFLVDHDAGIGSRKMRKQRVDLDAAESASSAASLRVEERKKAAASATKERLLLEKKMAKKRAEMDKKSPEAARLKEEIGRLAKKQRSDERALESKRKAKAAQQERVANMQQELQQVETELQQLESEAQAEASKGKLEFNAELLGEYHAIKAEAGAKTSKLQTDRQAQESAQQADEEALRSVEEIVSALEQRMQQIEEETAAAESAKATAEEAVAEVQTELGAKRKEHKQVADDARKNSTRREACAVRLDEVSGQLREARADRKEDERGRRQQQAVEALKRLFKGVYGRVTDLASVSQRKYNLALAVLMGQNMDSVIVEDESAAKEAIQYLKQQRMAPMTFIPVQTVQTKPINERLRQLGGTAKLAIDVLQYDAKLERAFVFICANTLVCDTADEARRIAFNGTDRHKVVAADGTLFSKGGCITGGLSQGMEAKAARWDDRALETLMQEEQQLQQQLACLPTQRDAMQSEARLAAAIQGLEAALALRRDEAAAAQAKMARMQAEKETLQKRKAERLPEAEQLRGAIAKRRKALDQLQKRINEITDRLFTPFSKKVGVANIREYEEGALRRAEQLAQDKAALASKLSKLRSELEYEQSANDHDRPIQQLQAGLAKIAEKLEKLQQQDAKAQEVRAAAEAELESEAARVAELRQAAEAVDGEVRALRAEATKCAADAAKVRRSVASLESVLESMRAARADLLERAALMQVDIPFLDGDEGAASGQQQEEEEGAEAMDVDGRGAGPSSAPGAAAAAAAGGEGGIVSLGRAVDYSGLRRQHQSAVGPKEREHLERQLEANIQETEAKLDRVAPNLKALEQYDLVREKEKEQQAELDGAKAAAQQAVQEFNEVRQQRLDQFSAAFEHVAAAIDPIYKHLTRSAAHPLGGTAYLSAESTDEPFLHGLKFTAMPPTKRFRDMEQLSGGEKTVAALALLFAIHSFQPSPFFVLDEVDAALDASNVARVATYIQEKTRAGAAGSFQSIVISLKDSFYDKADGLVGVCRDAGHGCSATFTFDLTRYD